MYALGIGNDLMVPYAAALIMEIYKDADNYVVEVFYRNDTSKDPYPMALPGCGTPCTVANMTDLYSNVRLDSYASQQAVSHLLH
ncbi:unnamed protein product [Nippostrongylus brasiliensis]|uniref:Lipase n=1 Tax=Nippostrongylus brasiliensis TaxID=27835 RepID=A0A0N4YM80_NIPBR|nr:unnamed protein product [Nippostrongylus brasiliensis]